MRQHFDPTGEEADMLAHFRSAFVDSRVLEIGCGDGRLTLPIAEVARSVLAIDPNEEAIAIAIAELPPHLAHKVEYQARGVVGLTTPPGSYEVVFFSRSL